MEQFKFVLWFNKTLRWGLVITYKFSVINHPLGYSDVIQDWKG